MTLLPRPAAAGDPVLDDALAAFRRDVAGVRAAPDLASRVLAATERAEADGEDELDRMRRLARGYAAAAAVLLALGVGGTFVVRSQAKPAVPSAGLADLESHRLSLLGIDSVADLNVGGR